ncbi:MAG: membrane integrity-associated transporter subunit PqiC [Rhodobiaceae bacterium]|nr:membrane integrity-associated transporter subunit PqiC [Rhodobiaceae bacterium]
MALLAAQVSGCALLAGPGPAPTTYDLTARAGGNLGRTGAQLAVREPRAIQLLDSERIVFRPSAENATYYGDAQWTDRLPKLIEAQLVESFAQGGVRTISRTTDGLNVDYQLMTELRDFSVMDGPGGQVARVAIYAQLVADTEGRALSGELFVAEAAVKGSDTPAGVAALNEALGSALTGVVRWTLRRI